MSSVAEILLNIISSYLLISWPQPLVANTAQKMRFYIKDFFSKCDQTRSFLRI